MREDAISWRGSKLVRLWFTFPGRRIKVPYTPEFGPFAADVHDNGNADDTDQCTTTCVLAKCGDGLLHVGVEQCDDGNLVANDGCDPACKLE